MKRPDSPASSNAASSNSLRSSPSSASIMSIGVINSDFKSSSSLFSRFDISSTSLVTSVPIKRVYYSDFDAYLKQITEPYQVYSASRKTESQVLLTPYSRSVSPSSDEKSLALVPKMFFESDFSMEDPRFFDKAYEIFQVESQISCFLDTVESHLAHEISFRSDSFFLALENLESLQEESRVCLNQVKELRESLSDVSRVYSCNALDTVRLTSKRKEIRKLHDVTVLLFELKQTFPTISALLAQNDYEATLGFISEAFNIISNLKLIKNQKNQIKIVNHFSVQMSNHVKNYAEKLEQEFCANFETLVRLKMANNGNLDIIGHFVRCLIRIDGFPGALSLLNDKLCLFAKELITAKYPNELIENSEKSQFAKSLKNLSLDAFLSFFQILFKNCILFIKSCVFVQEKLKASIEESLKNGIVASEKNIFQNQKQIDVSNEVFRVLRNVYDAYQTKCVYLLGLRAEQNAQLSLKDFLRLYNIHSNFFMEMDSLFLDPASQTLKSALQLQSNSFLTHFHMERSKQLSMLVENEQWVAADVLDDFQNIFSQILRAESNTGSVFDSEEKKIHALNIGGVDYHVPFSALMLGKMINEYLSCLESIPNIAVEVCQKLSELLKSFNQRVYQMILEAGAVQSAGLKNINAKHLSICSQCISAAIMIFPPIRSAILSKLSEKQNFVLLEFDKVCNDFTEHKTQIFKKLIYIMEDRLGTQCRDFSLVDWESMKPETQSSPIETMVRESTLLHKVISKILPVVELKQIFKEIFTLYTTSLTLEISKTKISSVVAKNNLLSDVQYFIQKLNSLPLIDGLDNSLEIQVNKITILKQKTSPPKFGNIFKSNPSQDSISNDAPSAAQKAKQNASEWMKKMTFM